MRSSFWFLPCSLMGLDEAPHTSDNKRMPERRNDMQTIAAKSILTRVQWGQQWFGVDYNMNIYRGCCHGCIYCDSRSDCYRNPEFDIVKAKQSAIGLLRAELRSRTIKGVVATGAMSDPYNPLEAENALTRQALELLARHGFGAAIATKSDGVVRDIDVLRSIQAHAPVLIKITITSAEDVLCKRLEPHASLTSARLQAIESLAKAGIFCGVLLMPVLPFITDHAANLCKIVRLASDHGARFVYLGLGVTLRDGQRTYFYQQLEQKFLGLKEKYMRTFGNMHHCAPPQAQALWQVFVGECQRQGMLYRMEEIIDAYKRPFLQEQIGMFFNE